MPWQWLIADSASLPQTNRHSVRTGAAAAIPFGLTAYDAAYVDLAGRKNLTLATLDLAMQKAAEAAGVRLFL